MKDRVVDLNITINRQLEIESKRMSKLEALKKSKKEESPDGESSTNHKQKMRMMKKNTLYRNYVQVADYIVQSMYKELVVMREWKILFESLRDANEEEQREKERNIQNRNRRVDEENVDEMQAKHDIDDEGQTILCHLILSCIRKVVGKLKDAVINVKQKRGRKTLKVFCLRFLSDFK